MPLESAELSARYAKYLWKRNVAGEYHEEYQKCLMRFLESSAEAPQCQRDAELIRHFMKELASDNQPLPQRQHAANAVSLYLQMLKEEGSCLRDGGTDPPTGSMTHREGDAHPQSQPTMFRRFSRYSEAGYTLKSDSPEWDRLIDTLAAEVKVRQMWSGKKQQCPLVQEFVAAKNCNALLCSILERQKVAMPSCAVFWSGKKQQWPLVQDFEAIKNNNALLCRILERQKTTMPSCAGFWSCKKLQCPLVQDFGAAKSCNALLCRNLERQKTVMPSCAEF